MKNNSSSNFKILLVDDDEITNYITTTKLKNQGFENIEAVIDGQLALDYLKDNTPSLIILDVNMPVMDGFEFLEELSIKSIYQDIPIAMLTSSGRLADKEKAAKYKNVIAYLEKPLSYENIQNILLTMNKSLT
ncbi:response regulator [Cellulophaga sp. L1A9]|uniref:response regulator n=1 Tax=Cellulophaga sp. L1A9 TaxID=2686362 RepID=UPI00131AF214|nr:response regulator [Cellulophaga sp. L1A9]